MRANSCVPAPRSAFAIFTLWNCIGRRYFATRLIVVAGGDPNEAICLWVESKCATADNMTCTLESNQIHPYIIHLGTHETLTSSKIEFIHILDLMHNI